MKNRSTWITCLVLSVCFLSLSCRDIDEATLGEQKQQEVFEKGLGLVPTTEEEWSHIKPIPRLRSRARGNAEEELPKFFSIATDMPPVGDQKGFPTCSSWATAYGVASYFNHLRYPKISYLKADGKRNDALVISPFFVHGYAVNLKPTESEPNPDPCKRGGSIYTAMAVITSWGVCPMEKWNEEEFIKSGCKRAATKAELNDAAKYKLFDGMPYGGKDFDVEGIKENLLKKRPTILGLYVDKAFMSNEPKDSDYVCKSIVPTSPALLHALVIIGYDDRRGAFQVYNSWGKDWKNKGTCLVSYEALEKVATEIWIPKPSF